MPYPGEEAYPRDLMYTHNVTMSRAHMSDVADPDGEVMRRASWRMPS